MTRLAPSRIGRVVLLEHAEEDGEPLTTVAHGQVRAATTVHFVHEKAMEHLTHVGTPVREERGGVGKDDVTEELAVRARWRENLEARFAAEEVDILVDENECLLENLWVRDGGKSYRRVLVLQKNGEHGEHLRVVEFGGKLAVHKQAHFRLLPNHDVLQQSDVHGGGVEATNVLVCG